MQLTMVVRSQGDKMLGLVQILKSVAITDEQAQSEYWSISVAKLLKQP